MGLILNTNIESLTAQRNLWHNTMANRLSLEKLSSGKKINHASDDSSGLSISDTLQVRIKSYQRVMDNAQDGVNILQIGEGALGVIGENLQRLRELAIQAANDTNSTTERSVIAQEITARLKDVDRIANTTRGNNVHILDGSKSNYLIQIGIGDTSGGNIINIGNVFSNTRSSALGLTIGNMTAVAGGRLESNSSVRALIQSIDNAINTLNGRRSSLGSYQNAMQSTISNISTTIENLQTTYSRIRDLDVAEESSKLVHSQILQESNITILSQANMSPTYVLKLIA
jgi:flagellin